MPTISNIALAVLSVGAAVLLVYWVMGLYKIVRTLTLIPTARSGLALAAARTRTPSVTVIVASYNEARVIEGLVRSLLTQDYPNVRFVLAMDRCTDDTAGIARRVIAGDPRFVVHEITECAADWTGKCHAVWSAVRDVPGVRDSEYLVFADADTIFTPPCVSAAVALIQHRGVDMLSLISTLVAKTWFELVVQPATSIELMRQYPLISANRDKSRRAFADGQFLMFTKAAYEKVGGHEAVRHALLDDLEFARRMEMIGLRVGVLVADGILYCHMYPDWETFARGWRRIFMEAAHHKAARLTKYSLIVRAIGTVAPAMSLALFLWALLNPTLGGAWHLTLLILPAAALAVSAFALGLVYWFAHAPLWSVPAFPVGAWIAGGLLSDAAKDLRSGKPVNWGGRQYTLKSR